MSAGFRVDGPQVLQVADYGHSIGKGHAIRGPFTLRIDSSYAGSTAISPDNVFPYSETANWRPPHRSQYWGSDIKRLARASRSGDEHGASVCQVAGPFELEGIERERARWRRSAPPSRWRRTRKREARALAPARRVAARAYSVHVWQAFHCRPGATQMAGAHPAHPSRWSAARGAVSPRAVVRCSHNATHHVQTPHHSAASVPCSRAYCSLARIPRHEHLVTAVAVSTRAARCWGSWDGDLHRQARRLRAMLGHTFRARLQSPNCHRGPKQPRATSRVHAPATARGLCLSRPACPRCGR